MQIALLLCAFLVIVILLAINRPLYQAMLGGIIALTVLYRIPLLEVGGMTLSIFTNYSSFSVLLSLYLITFLQRMLESRKQIVLVQEDLNGLFHNRRVNAMGAPIFIGLLPSAAAMILCGDIVKGASEGYLEPKEQAVLTSWVRHIPESTLPTYTAVLLMMTLSGKPLGTFIIYMIIPVIVLAAIPYFFYVRKLPKDPGTPVSTDRKRDAVNLFRHLWSLLAVVALILVFDLSVDVSVLIVIVVGIFVYKFKPFELKTMVRTAFEKKLLLNTFLVLVLKELISCTGVLELLPDLFNKLPIPAYLAFALLFLVGGVISGSQGIIAMGTPLAFAAMPDGGFPLMVLLMCMCHAAAQLSPTHICLVVAAEYYGVTMGQIIRKTIPLALLFSALMIGYYNILLLL